MRLLFISQLFDPEYSIKGLDFLTAINKTGIDVDVITTFPNYPTGNIYPGYKNKIYQITHHDGIRVIRVYSYISHSRSKLARLLSYLSFMCTALIASLIIRKPDVIYAYHPQITMGILAWSVRLVRQTPFIIDIQDLWPDALVATGSIRYGLVYRLIERVCNFIYKKSDHIVVLSKGYMRTLIQRGVPSQKISVVYNWNSGDERITNESDDNLFSRANEYENKFVYAGNLGAAQSLKSVITAFSQLQDSSVCLIIIGAGVEGDELADFTKSINGENIFFLGYIQSNMIQQYLTAADVLVVHLKDEPLFKITIPSKIQAYLYAGKPILMAVGGESNAIIEDAGAGIGVLPGNVRSIMNGIQLLVERRSEWEEMGKMGKQYYLHNMSQSLAVEKISSLLNIVSLKKNAL